VLLAYVDKDQALEGAGLELKDLMLNPPPQTLGQVVQAKLIDLLQRGEIRKVINRVLPIESLLSALAAFEGREVRGRIIIEN
jgi:hypothetical protein